VNKTELLALLDSRLGSHSAAVAALDAVLDEIQRAVSAGERVAITGFGTFDRIERPARTGRNPRTGAALEIAASSSPRFRAGSALRAAAAGQTSPGPRPVASRRVTEVLSSLGRSTTSHEATGAVVASSVLPVQTVQPGTAVKAGKNAKPVKAAKPTKPAKSVKAGKPTKPAKSVKPAKPTKTAKPGAEAAAATSAKKAKVAKKAKPAKKAPPARKAKPAKGAKKK
jgi:DNA-binding protein HU-beta